MDATTMAAPGLSSSARRLFHRLALIAENRFQLLLVEVEEERDRLLGAVFLALATATLGLLGIILWTGALVMYLWQYGPLMTLIGLGALYVAIALALCLKLVTMLRNHKAMAATLEELRKDRECLKAS